MAFVFFVAVIFVAVVFVAVVFVAVVFVAVVFVSSWPIFTCFRVRARRAAEGDPPLKSRPRQPISYGMTLDGADRVETGERSDRLGLYVRHLVGDGELPLFSKRLLELLALPNQEQTSAQKLAELVLEDYALTVNVLRVANSFHYNRSNRAIESISHAIVVLGMRTVHKLASTLVYFLSFEHRSNSLRRLMIRSMLSAHIAGVVAEMQSLRDREEVYLAGMFQNLGEVLVACHSPIQHAEIEAQITAGASPDEAAVHEVGFTYDDLARAVSRHWKLSPQLAAIWDANAMPTTLTTLARFGHDLTRMMCVQPVRHREASMKLLMMRYGVRLGVTQDQVIDVWERAVEETRSTFVSLGLDLADSW